MAEIIPPKFATVPAIEAGINDNAIDTKDARASLRWLKAKRDESLVQQDHASRSRIEHGIALLEQRLGIAPIEDDEPRPNPGQPAPSMAPAPRTPKPGGKPRAVLVKAATKSDWPAEMLDEITDHVDDLGPVKLSRSRLDAGLVEVCYEDGRSFRVAWSEAKARMDSGETLGPIFQAHYEKMLSEE